MPRQAVPYETMKAKMLENPELRRDYEALEPAYQLACLRIEQGLSQEELAERVGTKQPNIARLESGRHQPSIGLLRRVAEALGARLVITVERTQEDT